MTTVDGTSGSTPTPTDTGVEGEDEYDDVDLEDGSVDSAESADSVDSADASDSSDSADGSSTHWAAGISAASSAGSVNEDGETSSGYFPGIGTADNFFPYESGTAPTPPPDETIILDMGNERYVEIPEDEPFTLEMFEDLLDKFYGVGDSAVITDEEKEQFLGRFQQMLELDGTTSMPIGDAMEDVLGVDITQTVNKNTEVNEFTYPDESVDDIGMKAQNEGTQAVKDDIFSQLPIDILEEIEDIKGDIEAAIINQQDPYDTVIQSFDTIRQMMEEDGHGNNVTAMTALASALCESAVENGPPEAASILMGLREGIDERGPDNAGPTAKDICAAAFVLNGEGLAAFHDTNHSRHRDMKGALESQDWEAVQGGDEWKEDNREKFFDLTHDHISPFGMLLGGASGGSVDDGDANRDAMAEVAEEYGARWRTNDGDSWSNEGASAPTVAPAEDDSSGTGDPMEDAGYMG